MIQTNIPRIEENPDLNPDDFYAHMTNKKLLVHERALYATKWWDYRFMSFTEATFAYIDAFGKAARAIYAREIDYERAKHIRTVTAASIKMALCGVFGDIKKAKTNFTGFWRGRQVADALGMPYETYTELAIASRMRAWKRIYLPTPLQVYSSIDVEKVQARWEEMKASRIMFATHHGYLAQNFVGAPAQTAYADYLLEEAKKRAAHEMELLRDFVQQDRICVEYLRQKLPRDKYDGLLKSLC